MVFKPEFLKESPSQTAGPYVHIGTTPNFCDIRGVYPADLGATMLHADTPGQRIVLSGRVTDGDGMPVNDAVLEIWQANADGVYDSPKFHGWGRQAADGDGAYRFETVKPGSPGAVDGKPMAPHVTFWIVARGINIGLHTRAYFGDETDANAVDPLLRRIPDPQRRATLIAALTAPGEYRFDIRLQGEGETVFLDI